jgi:hypothetical protein
MARLVGVLAGTVARLALIDVSVAVWQGSTVALCAQVQLQQQV